MVIVHETPHDRALPQLATILDGEAMAALFNNVLSAAQQQREYQVLACEIERIKYKPEQNILISYRLEIAEVASGRKVEQRFCARVYPLGRSESRFRRAQTQPLVQAQAGPPLLHLPEVGMVLWGFPNDRKLLGLPKLMDAAYLEHEVLPAVVAAHWGEEWRIHSLRNELVHYAPEYIATVRTQLQLVQPQTGEEQVVTLFGKLYEDEQGAETDRLMRALWASEARRAADLIIAQPLGYHPGLKILWQRGLHGTTLQSHELISPRLRLRLVQAAETVAALHQSPVMSSRSIYLADWIDRLEEMRCLLPEVRPSCESMVNTVVDRLRQCAEGLEAQPVALLHGDLHLQNFFVEGDRVALIDLDDLCLGSPWQDIGSFSAALHYRGLVAGTELGEIEEATGLFYRHYLQKVPWSAPRATVDWFTAAALINERAFRSIARLQSGSLDILDAILARAQKILTG